MSTMPCLALRWIIHQTLSLVSTRDSFPTTFARGETLFGEAANIYLSIYLTMRRNSEGNLPVANTITKTSCFRSSGVWHKQVSTITIFVGVTKRTHTVLTDHCGHPSPQFRTGLDLSLNVNTCHLGLQVVNEVQLCSTCELEWFTRVGQVSRDWLTCSDTCLFHICCEDWRGHLHFVLRIFDNACEASLMSLSDVAQLEAHGVTL